MFSQYPSNDRWCSWLAALPDGHLLYTTASIVIGPLHSFPLNLKYHRLHPSEVSDLRFPWNETLSAVFDVSLLKVQSCERIIVEKTTILKKALVYHWSRMFMDVIYRVKSCKNRQTNKEKNKTKTKTKTWEYTQYENIILLITGYHTALGWAVGISPHDIDLSTQTVMYLNRSLYLWYKFWNHWWALQFNWLSAVWFIRESPDFLL